MSRNTKHFKSRRSFTMVELLAVITITAILLTITISVVRVDSTKANASVLGAALNYAQAYSVSKINSNDYIQVEIDTATRGISIFHHVYDLGTSAYQAPTTLETYSLRKGSEYSVDGDTPVSADQYYFYFNNRGEPLNSSITTNSALANTNLTNIQTSETELNFFVH